VYAGFRWGKPEENRPLGKPMHTWKDNIKMNLQDMGLELMWLRIHTGGRHL
jgi:hypothetical protein